MGSLIMECIAFRNASFTQPIYRPLLECLLFVYFSPLASTVSK